MGGKTGSRETGKSELGIKQEVGNWGNRNLGENRKWGKPGNRNLAKRISGTNGTWRKSDLNKTGNWNMGKLELEEKRNGEIGNIGKRENGKIGT